MNLVNNVHQEKYYVGGDWRKRDMLLKVPGVDETTRDAVASKHKKRKKDYVDGLKRSGVSAAVAAELALDVSD